MDVICWIFLVTVKNNSKLFLSSCILSELFLKEIYSDLWTNKVKSYNNVKDYLKPHNPSIYFPISIFFEYLEFLKTPILPNKILILFILSWKVYSSVWNSNYWYYYNIILFLKKK